MGRLCAGSLGARAVAPSYYAVFASAAKRPLAPGRRQTVRAPPVSHDAHSFATNQRYGTPRPRPNVNASAATEGHHPQAESALAGEGGQGTVVSRSAARSLLSRQERCSAISGTVIAFTIGEMQCASRRSSRAATRAEDLDGPNDPFLFLAATAPRLAATVGSGKHNDHITLEGT